MKNVIIILLLGINVAMGIVLMSTNNKLKNANLLLDKQNEKIIMLDHTIDKCYMSFLKANNQSIKSFFAAAGVFELNNFHTQRLVVLIPPYPCDVCLDHELENLHNRMNLKDEKIIVVAPNFRIRDLKINFENNSDVKFIGYDLKDVKDEVLFNLDAILYFAISGELIYDLFVTNGSYSKYSKFYLEN